MVDLNELCFACMEKKGDGDFCQHCGFNNKSYEPPAHHLKPGTILAGKYILGKALGEGGFGITYVGYDINLDLKIAIKEYFPSGFVSRDVSNTDTITVFSGSEREAYEAGKEKFIKEAKALAKFDNMPGIVSVKDFFLENGTAYIAMEFVEGETLKEYLNKMGGKAQPELIFNMIRPLIESLSQIHRQGIIHRDISPDNIMITKNNEVKLLDFGAARDINAAGQKSLSIQLKPGYAPEEQYRTHGEQGPWTDVYALCATIYRAITGVTPIESLERLSNDTLAPPSYMGVMINPAQEQALMQGLAVNRQQRIQDMNVLFDAFYRGANPMPNPVPPPNPNSNSKTLVIVLITVCAVILAVAIGIIGAVFVGGGESEPQATEAPKTTEAPKATAAPTAVPAPVMTNVTASSTRGTDSEGGQYSKEAVLSEDIYTKWVPAKSSGDGVGEWIQLSSDSMQYVKGLKILNGYHKNESTWFKNNRVQRCMVTFSNGNTKDFVLNDTMELINLDFGETVATSSVRITIGSVYYGSRWNDTAITYIGLY